MEEKRCQICEEGEGSIKHLIRHVENRNKKLRIEDILKEEGKKEAVG